MNHTFVPGEMVLIINYPPWNGYTGVVKAHDSLYDGALLLSRVEVHESPTPNAPLTLSLYNFEITPIPAGATIDQIECLRRIHTPPL